MSLREKLNYTLNKHYNNELEKQVDTLQQKDQQKVVSYYKRLMSWNIKLSDLETANYFVIWLGVIACFFTRRSQLSVPAC